MRVWLVDLTYDQQFVAADTMPLSIATLRAYVMHNRPGKDEIRLFKYPQKLIDALESDPWPDAIGFSNFIWNSIFSLRFVEHIRSRAPGLPVIFGGLNYPNEASRQEVWLRHHPTVDFYVYKEGENGLLTLLNALEASGCDAAAVKEQDIPGVHYLRADGSAHITPAAERVRDLASFESPYLNGSLDEFFDGKLMPLITTNRGCPFQCGFCSEGASYYSVVNKSNVDRVAAEFTYIAQRIAAAGEGFPQRNIYITDSNFGMFKEDVTIARTIRDIKARYDWPEYIHTTTGKNHKERVLEVAKILEGGMRLSGSVQSTDPEVQKNVRRQNIRADELMSVALEAGNIGANTYSEIILALPGDSLAAHVQSLRTMVNARYDYVIPHQLVILPDSDLATEANRERFAYLTRWRPLTKSHGVYRLGGKPLVAAEVEEVCVGGINMSFEDYLEARRINFVLNTFYNDRLLSGFLSVLDFYDIPRFEWLEKVYAGLAAHPAVRQCIEDFIADTREELWDTEEELRAFLSVAENTERLVSGELGANLLAKYRIVLVTEHMESLCDAARDGVAAALRERGLLDDDIAEFLNELALFERQRKRQAFDLHLDDTVELFRYDMIAFTAQSHLNDLGALRLPQPRRIEFRRSPEIRAMIERNHRVYGSTRSGIYKQTTRTPVKKLYREARFVD